MESQDILALLIVGAMAGTAAASILRGQKPARTSDWIRNTVIGVLGALVGGFLFDVLNLNQDLPKILSGTLTPADVLVAFVGALIVIAASRLIRD
ncbi:MAG: GlsB/YeaQ/YmgE family stress response membrane protein [Chloroflexi bacterium]|nr:GlsB/YeaQ/YmgE family stress response membrane protein [Chloroflexota bacterium]